MDARRVGVISQDDSLVVHLALRGDGLQVDHLGSVDDLDAHDVALLDVGLAQDAAEVVASIPRGGPAVVLLCAEDPDLPQVRTVLRPCSIDDLLDALATVPTRTEVAEDLVVSLEEPVAVAPAAPAPGPGLFDARDSSVDGTAPPLREPPPPAWPPPPLPPLLPAEPPPGVEAQDAEVRDAEVRDAEPGDPSDAPGGADPDEVDAPAPPPPVTTPPSAEVLAMELAAAVRDCRTAAQLADRVAALVAEALEADHVALWAPDGDGDDEYTVLGASGLSVGARTTRMDVQHPMVLLARSNQGTLIRGQDHLGTKAPGLPGSVAPTYAMLLLDEDDALAPVVTIGAPEVTEELAIDVRAFVVDAGAAWRAAPW